LYISVVTPVKLMMIRIIVGNILSKREVILLASKATTIVVSPSWLIFHLLQKLKNSRS